MNNTTCTICANAEIERHSILFEIKQNDQEVYTLKKCSDCQTVYTYFTHQLDITTYYDEKDYVVRDTKKSIFYKIQEFEYSIVLKKIKKLLPIQNYLLLDFGSGKGLFLHFAKRLGFKGKGIESSKPRADYARSQFGLEISTTYYTKGQVFEEKFGTITLFHVLEHIKNPATTLNNLIEENLENKGLVVIEVPNIESWQAQWAKNRWLHLDIPRHLSHFTPHTVSKIVEQSGCKVIKKEYFSYHLGIIGMTQTILNWFGYRGFLIGDLKQNKSLPLLLKITLALPWAILLETLASIFKRGGVIRCYAIKNQEQ